MDEFAGVFAAALSPADVILMSFPGRWDSEATCLAGSVNAHLKGAVMTITDNRRVRFYVEAVLAALFALTAGMLLWRPDWIEALTGMDPDRGSGLAEWIIVLVLAAASLLLTVSARREWVRAAARTAQPAKGRT